MATLSSLAGSFSHRSHVTVTAILESAPTAEPISTETWVDDRLRVVAELYDISAEGRDLATLEVAVRSVHGSSTKQELERVVGEVFGGR